MASCATPGASIGWTTQPPGEVRERTDVEVLIGSPEDDGRHWTLYGQPVPRHSGVVRFRAWRLGFQPSEEVVVVGGSRDDVGVRTVPALPQQRRVADSVHDTLRDAIFAGRRHPAAG